MRAGSWGLGIKRPFKFQLHKTTGGTCKVAKLESSGPLSYKSPSAQARGELGSWGVGDLEPHSLGKSTGFGRLGNGREVRFHAKKKT